MLSKQQHASENGHKFKPVCAYHLLCSTDLMILGAPVQWCANHAVAVRNAYAHKLSVYVRHIFAAAAAAAAATAAAAADLSILGAPLQRYADYAVAVRKEYGHLSDEEYTQGRYARLVMV
jgi:predicted metal-dependent HD superfamily phosphohydrolase